MDGMMSDQMYIRHLTLAPNTTVDDVVPRNGIPSPAASSNASARDG